MKSFANVSLSGSISKWFGATEKSFLQAETGISNRFTAFSMTLAKLDKKI